MLARSGVRRSRRLTCEPHWRLIARRSFMKSCALATSHVQVPQSRKLCVRILTVHTTRDVVAERRTMLERMTRSAARNPDILHLRVAVDQEVLIRGVLELTHAIVHQRLLCHVRESECEVRACAGDRFSGRKALVGVGVERLVAAGRCDLETRSEDIREPVGALSRLRPVWEVGIAEARVASRW